MNCNISQDIIAKLFFSLFFWFKSMLLASQNPNHLQKQTQIINICSVGSSRPLGLVTPKNTPPKVKNSKPDIITIFLGTPCSCFIIFIDCKLKYQVLKWFRLKNSISSKFRNFKCQISFIKLYGQILLRSIEISVNCINIYILIILFITRLIIVASVIG